MTLILIWSEWSDLKWALNVSWLCFHLHLRLSTCDRTTQDGLQTQMETMLTCLQNSQWAETGLSLEDGILNVKFHFIDYVLFLWRGHEGGGALTGKQVVRPEEP